MPAERVPPGEQTGRDGTRYDDALLDDLRSQGDPAGDAAAAAWFADRAGDGHASFFRAAGGSQDDPVLAAWLADEPSLPACAEPARLDRAGAFFAEHGLTLGLALSCSALPPGYASGPVANVLGCG